MFLALSVIAYILWEARPLILPVTLGILFAYLFRPLKTAFKYSWLPNGVRIVLLFTVLTGGLLFGIKFVKDSLPNEKEKLEILVRMKYQLNEKFEKLMNINPATGKGNTFYNLIAEDVNPIRQSLNDYLELSPEQIVAFTRYSVGVEGFDVVPDKFYRYFLSNLKRSKKIADEKIPVKKSEPIEKGGVEQSSFLKTVINVLSIWFLFPIVFLFFLLDDGEISQFFIKLIPNRYFELALAIREEVDDAIGQYLRGISMQCFLVGVTMGIGLHIIGVPMQMALIIGILSGLATAIPFLGPLVGLSFGLIYWLIAEDIHPILTLVTMENFPISVICVNAMVLLLDNLVFQPIILGGSVDLHPLVVILGITCASLLFGMAGVLLAIPTIVVAKVIVQHTFRGLRDYRII
jgi:predicted PurR-regulated permease PerM